MDSGGMLLMLRYKLIGNSIISVNLKNGYSVNVISKWNKDENAYRMSWYLQGDTYDTWDLIEEKDNVLINSDRKTLFFDVTKTITDCLVDGFFEHYIERYEYMMKCFDKGNEFFESAGENNAD